MIRTALDKVNQEIHGRQNSIETLRNKINEAEPLTYQDVEEVVKNWDCISNIEAIIRGLEIAKSILEDLCLSHEPKEFE